MNKDFKFNKQTLYKIYGKGGALYGRIELIINKYIFKPIGQVSFYDSKELKEIANFLIKLNKEYKTSEKVKSNGNME